MYGNMNLGWCGVSDYFINFIHAYLYYHITLVYLSLPSGHGEQLVKYWSYIDGGVAALVDNYYQSLILMERASLSCILYV